MLDSDFFGVFLGPLSVVTSEDLSHLSQQVVAHDYETWRYREIVVYSGTGCPGAGTAFSCSAIIAIAGISPTMFCSSL